MDSYTKRFECLKILKNIYATNIWNRSNKGVNESTRLRKKHAILKCWIFFFIFLWISINYIKGFYICYNNHIFIVIKIFLDLQTNIKSGKKFPRRGEGGGFFIEFTLQHTLPLWNVGSERPLDEQPLRMILTIENEKNKTNKQTKKAVVNSRRRRRRPMQKLKETKKTNKKEPKEDGENCTKVSGGDLNESIVEYPNQSRTHNSWNETVIVVCMFVFK